MSSFQDQLRRQYLCNDLHMQIRYLHLHYKTSDGDASANMMQDDWNSIQGLMRDSANTDSVFNIGFEPVDESEEVFDTDYQPALEGYLTSANNNDIQLTVAGLALQ
jgi:aromatic ring hydroxylase